MSRVTGGDRTDAWVNGDPITETANGDLGFVKWTHPRKSDGKRFLRVRVTSGPDAGKEVWENGLWTIGQGRAQVSCADCGYPFRTDDPKAGFCPCCRRTQRPNYDPTAVPDALFRARLRGNATPGFQAVPAPPSNEPRPVDDEEYPF